MVGWFVRRHVIGTAPNITITVRIPAGGSPAYHLNVPLIGLGGRLYFFGGTLSYYNGNAVVGVSDWSLEVKTFIGVAGDSVIFLANDGQHGTELWSSNGTQSGTFMIIDTERGTASSYPTGLANINGELTFVASPNFEYFGRPQILTTSFDSESYSVVDGAGFISQPIENLQHRYEYQRFSFGTPNNVREIRSWDGKQVSVTH